MVAVVPRAQWGAAFGVSPNRVPLSSRRFFVLHWPGGAVGGDEAAMVRAIERDHRVRHGWSAVPGYNFLVGQSGTVFEGAGRDIRGVHSPPRNVDGFGVCVMHPTTAPPTQAALNATRALYDNLCHVVGRPLHTTWHSADVATACPGSTLVAWARAGMPATGAPPPPRPFEERGAMDIRRAPGGGYYVVASDGGVFTFGDAPFFGSMGDQRMNAPVVGMAVRPQGDGYVLVGSDGGIFTFGAAVFHGSTGDTGLNLPIISAEYTPSGNGYWLLGRDGGVFTFGDAPFHGAAVGKVR